MNNIEREAWLQKNRDIFEFLLNQGQLTLTLQLDAKDSKDSKQYQISRVVDLTTASKYTDIEKGLPETIMFDILSMMRRMNQELKERVE